MTYTQEEIKHVLSLQSFFFINDFYLYLLFVRTF